MSRAVMQQALEALEWNYNTDLDNIAACEQWAKMLKETITALRAALAEPEQDELRRLHAENEALREANEAFGKRQEWWNDKMVALEAINAELREALREMLKLWQDDPAYGHDAADRARAALAKVASNGS